MTSSTDRPLKVHNLHPQKGLKWSALDELNVISHEIDKQLSKKTLEILELLKEFLSGSLDKSFFIGKMREASNISLGDLTLLARKLIKRHKFEINPNYREFLRIKFLQFPTSSKDIGELTTNNVVETSKFLSIVWMLIESRPDSDAINFFFCYH